MPTTGTRRGAEKLLSDPQIRKEKARKAPFRLSDGGGLHLEIRPTGARLWRYRYRLGGKENVFAIGAYPEISLAKARDARDDARTLVRDQHVHPAHQRKTDKIRAQYENANTFAAVAREWLEEHREHKDAPWTQRTYRQRKNLLANDVYPHIGSLPLRQVTPAHAHAVLKRIERRAPQMAAIARQAFSAISRLGIATMRADLDLGYPLRSAVRLAPTQHKTPLREHQIKRFFEALDSYPGYLATKIAVRLLWLTLARPIEVIGARWDEIDLDEGTWSIGSSRMKMRQLHVVPLPTQATELLKTLRALSGRSEYLIPNRSNPKRHAAVTLLAKAFVSMGYEGKFTPHAVRVTGRTILGEQGHPKDVLERQLAHREKKHVRAYDQGDRLEARRIVMQGWADHLDGLCSGANVVSIKRQTR
jgi:integrase